MHPILSNQDVRLQQQRLQTDEDSDDGVREEDLVFTLFTADTALETLMVIAVYKFMLQNARASPNALFVLGLGFLAHKTTFLSEEVFLMY